jgi:cell division protein FtsB
MRTSIVALAICGALTAYFGYFALHGRHGLVSYVKVAQEVEYKEAELAQLLAERAALTRRVNSLKPQSLDLDLLEERARDALALSGPNELVLPRKPRAQD